MGTHFATRVPAYQYPTGTRLLSVECSQLLPAGTRIPVYSSTRVVLLPAGTRIPGYPFTALI